MIQIPAQATVIVMHAPVTFRYGIDGMAATVRLILLNEPMAGAFFVFRSKVGHSLRILYYDGSGYWLCTKRLSKGSFNGIWPRGDGAVSSPLLARELQILLWGANPHSCPFPPLWRQVS